MTRGVPGTVFGELDILEDRTVNGGSAEDQGRPTGGLVPISTLSQNIDSPPNDSMMGGRFCVVRGRGD